jgi:ribonuclease J
MTSITIYDGAQTIGGNKIYVEEKGKGIFLDFGMNFKKYERFFKDFLTIRKTRGIYDHISLGLIPKLKIYRKDLIPLDLDVSSFQPLNVEAILLSHAHMDHFGNIGLLNPEIPIISTPISVVLLKGIMDCTSAMLGSEVAYLSPKFSKDDNRVIESDRYNDTGRNFICTDSISEPACNFLSTCMKSKKKFEAGTLTNLNEFSSTFEINAFDVDHSIFGAAGFTISGDTTIAYTGDFRLHGINREKSKNFIKEAKNASILITEGTRAGREVVNESEGIVFDNCLIAIEKSKGLVVADFTSRNFERLETFHKIAKKVNRKLVVTSKDLFLLNALEKIDKLDRTSDILVYKELRTKIPGWEKKVLLEEINAEYVDPKDISKEQERYLLCFSLYDIKNLLDIKPNKGTYIYSSSEAFEEESEFDFVRLNNWLNYFGFNIYGFRINEESGRLKPEFIEGFHASGHAGSNDLIWAIETINPDYIIPVHTESPLWFKENFENVVLLNEGQKYIMK